MASGASRLGFRFISQRPDPVPPLPEVPPLADLCAELDDLTKEDLYALGEPSYGLITINTGYLLFTINGNLTGALGNVSDGPGLKYDPSGSGTNFGVDDYITPGFPWEAYMVKATSTSSGTAYIGGSNTDDAPPDAPIAWPTNAQWWEIDSETNHYAVLRGSDETGWLVIQYRSKPGWAFIQMKMTYQNTTGVNRTVYMMRGVDPDPDRQAYGTFNTNNQRGYSPIGPQELVYAKGVYSGKPISLYIPGNGYPHNTAIPSGIWTYDIPLILNGVNNGNGDRAITCAWNTGVVSPLTTVSVCCYYICGSNLEYAIGIIHGTEPS